MVQDNRKLAQAELCEVAGTVTEYGTVCRESTVNGEAGQLTIYHVSPFALLMHATEKSRLFSVFLARIVNAAPDNLLDIVFYLDKATPGNALRPDLGRAREAIY